MSPLSPQFMIFFFFFNDTATTEIYTLSLHDALPICMTETSPIGVVSKLLPRHDALSGEELVKVKLKQGRGVWGVDLKIVDDDGRPQPWDGQARGHLRVRGPWVARGYFKGIRRTACRGRR